MQNDQLNKSIRALEYIINLQKKISDQPILSNKYDELFSKMYYRYECSNLSRSDLLVSQYIEPLIGLLRDPLTICSYNNLPSKFNVTESDAIQSKRFFFSVPQHHIKIFER